MSLPILVRLPRMTIENALRPQARAFTLLSKDVEDGPKADIWTHKSKDASVLALG